MKAGNSWKLEKEKAKMKEQWDTERGKWHHSLENKIKKSKI
jgi:hypothetical protein